METMRLTLIFLHVFLIFFAAVNLKSHLNCITHVTDHGEATAHGKQISEIISYIFESFRLTLYHTASIIAIWFSHPYGAGMVRASGLLLIGELLQLMTCIIQEMLETKHLPNSELYFIVIYDVLLLTALLMTFRLAEKISKHQKSYMQVELLADRVHEIPIDNNMEPMIM
jgi:hypothetical protein